MFSLHYMLNSELAYDVIVILGVVIEFAHPTYKYAHEIDAFLGELLTREVMDKDTFNYLRP